jgi:hypothetical protein
VENPAETELKRGESTAIYDAGIHKF